MRSRVSEHGRDPLTQDNVRRLIEDVRGTGAPITDRSAEVIPGQPLVLRADHAGAFALGGGAVDGGVDGGIDNVIWWDCQASDRIHRWPWSRSERAALAQGGVLLQSEDEQLAWLGKAWLRPVLCARERCTFILHDDAERHHPLWDQIASSTEGLPVLQVSSSETAAQLGMAITPLAAHPCRRRCAGGSYPIPCSCRSAVRIVLQPGCLHPRPVSMAVALLRAHPARRSAA
ncbi:MAG: hypothetical protein IPG06_22260 [Haliea sp.]|nr:hypothetical protein [Haliea sp.]